jgi:two-component system, OmpR family, sensor histidine kinase CreC
MKSIRSRILILFTLLFGAGIVVFTHYIVGEVKPRFRAVLEEGLAESAHFYARAIETQATRLGIATIDAHVSELLPQRTATTSAPAPLLIYGNTVERLKLRVYVTDNNGTVVYSSWNANQIGQDFSRWNDVLKTLNGYYGARTTRDNEVDSESSVLYVAAPLRLNGTIAGVVTLGLPAKTSNQLIRIARYSLFSLACIVTCGLALVAWLISNWITRPLVQLQRYVLSLTATATPELPPLPDNEIGTLGKAIEQMHKKLVVQDFQHSYLQTLVHELRSPVTAILGACELVEDHSLMHPKGKPFLNTIAAETRRINCLLSNLLQLSELENRETLLDPQDFCINSLVAEVIESKTALLEQSGISLTASITPDLIWRGEPQLLRLAIQNLLQNAIDFSELGGKIRIEVLPEFPYELRVIDEGSGMPPWVQEKVFNEFFSLPRPRTGKKGTGFGLRLTRKIAQLHGGECTLCPNIRKGVVASITVALNVD